MIVILIFFISLEIVSKIFKYNIWFVNKASLNFDILTIKIWVNIWSLTSINSKLIGNNKIPAGKIDLNIDARLNTFELILLINDLAIKNFSLLYILLLNNSLKMTSLLINNLTDAN